MKRILREEYKYITKTTGDNTDPYERSDEPCRDLLVRRMEKLPYDVTFVTKPDKIIGSK